MRRLPIVFRALDLEAKTRPAPSVVCPVRAAVMTVGSCGRCAAFKRIEFDEAGCPVLCCDSGAAGCHARKRVQALLRVPVACCAPDTTLAAILPYVGMLAPRDAFPVLNWDSTLLGFLTVHDAQRLVESGISLDTKLCELMSRQPICVLPETELEDAVQLLLDTGAAQLFAVAPDGAFLGVLPANEAFRA